MGSKYSKAADKIQRENEFKDEQKRLHEKYDEPENMVIKEKSNMFKFVVNNFKGCIRIIASSVLLVLGVIGAITLIYPQPRAELLEILNEIISSLLDMIGK